MSTTEDEQPPQSNPVNSGNPLQWPSASSAGQPAGGAEPSQPGPSGDDALLQRPAFPDTESIQRFSPQQTQAAPYYAQSRPAMPPQYIGQPVGAAPKESILHRWRARGGLLGGLASILLLLAKIGGPLLALLKVLPFLKILLAAGSAVISMWVWAKATHMGWPFGIGIVVLIFIHECGHAFAARLRGIPTGIMVFIPLMGAFVTTKRYGRNIAEDAFIGIMGPVFGTLASLACLGVYFVHPAPIWVFLAMIGFWINLFNLAPTVPLDGGWIVPLFSPKLLAFGVVLLVLFGFRNPMIWVLGLLSLPRIISGWKAQPGTNPYYQATPAQKWKFGLAYFGLALFLALAYMAAGNMYHPSVMM